MSEVRSTQKARRRESPSGWHFHSLYLENPRHWYLKYALGLIPIFTKPALIKGGCLSEAKVAFWETRSVQAMIERFEAEIDSRFKEYEDSEVYEQDKRLGVLMLDEWFRTWNEVDFKEYDIIEFEKEYTIEVGPKPGFLFTIRPDRIVRHRLTGKYFLFEDKSTGWSVDKPIELARHDNQLTAYIWGLNQVHPEWKIDSAIVDVTYASSRAKVPTPLSKRSLPIIKTKEQLVHFEIQLLGLIIEISQKYQALSDLPCWLLFPRNGLYDGMFGCEYEGICDRDVAPGEVPLGFRRDDWSNELEVLKHIPHFDISQWKLRKETKE